MAQDEYLLPTWGFGIAAGADGKHKIFLEISNGFMQQSAYLCDAGDYMDVARKVHEGIMTAGKEAARMDSPLVAVNGSDKDNAAIIRTAQRQQRRSGRKGS